MPFPKWPRWVWRCYAATFAAVAAFVVCSLLPMWTVKQYVSDGECGLVTEDRHSLWGMLMSEQPRDDSDGIYKSVRTWEWETPATITAVAMHVAAIVGAILGGIRWRKGE